MSAAATTTLLDDRSEVLPEPLPITMGEPGRPLVGWHHAPTAGFARHLGIVLCPPFGYEVMCSHRAYRHLARALARAGFHVLRYDPDGCGDSAGRDVDPGRFQAWVASASHAVTALRARTGVSGVCLFGLRLGALVALAAAEKRDDVRALALWAAPSSGSSYLREARAFTLLKQEGDHPPDALGGQELAGYYLSAETLAEVGELRTTRMTPRHADHVLLLPRDDVPGPEAALAKALSAGPTVVETVAAAGYTAMMRDPEFSEVPDAAIAAVRDWLLRVDHREPPRAQPAPLARPAVPEPSISVRTTGGTRVRETVLRFGSHQNLRGIVATPTGAQGSTGVLFISAGANHHVGSSRFHVTLSRELASLGHVAMRMDVGGVGESRPAPGRVENDLYAMHSVADVRTALDLLQRRYGVERFVLVGLCSGAFLAFHACAADPRVAGQVLINPQTFVWRAGDSLTIKKSFKSNRFYRRNARSLETWKRLVRGEIDVRGIASTLLRRIWDRLDALPVPLPGESDVRSANRAVRRSFFAIQGRGTDTLMIYAADDGGLDTLQRYLGNEGRALAGRPSFRVLTLEGADHTFTPLWSQAWLHEQLLGFVMSRFA